MGLRLGATFSHRQGPFTLTVSGRAAAPSTPTTSGEVKWAQYYPGGDRSRTAATTTIVSTRTPRPARYGSPGTRGARVSTLSAGLQLTLRALSTCPRIRSRACRSRRGFSFVPATLRARSSTSAKETGRHPQRRARRGGRRMPASIYDPQDYWSVPARRPRPRERLIDYEAGVSLRRGALWRARVNALLHGLQERDRLRGSPRRQRRAHLRQRGPLAPQRHRGSRAPEAPRGIWASTATCRCRATPSRATRSSAGTAASSSLRREPDCGLPRRHGRADREDRARSCAAQRDRSATSGRFYLDNTEDNRKETPPRGPSRATWSRVNPAFTVFDAALQADLPLGAGAACSALHGSGSSCASTTCSIVATRPSATWTAAAPLHPRGDACGVRGSRDRALSRPTEVEPPGRPRAG